MPEAKDYLRLTEAERRAALETIERRSLAEPGRLNRREPRHRLVDLDRLVVDLGNGASAISALVVPRDVSDGGLSFLHGVFVYSGTPVLVQLKTRDGEQMLVPGKVVRCTHVIGRVHELGVKFDRPIDVTPFIAHGAADSAGSASPDAWAALVAHNTELASAIQAKDHAKTTKTLTQMQAALASKPAEHAAPTPSGAAAHAAKHGSESSPKQAAA